VRSGGGPSSARQPRLSAKRDAVARSDVDVFGFTTLR